MPNDPWWGWVLLGRLHPLIVHFPIGLIIAGALHDVVRWARGRQVPSDVGSFCLSLGLVSGALAVWFGTLNASHQEVTGASADILEWHRYAGWTLLLVGGMAFLAGRVARLRATPGVASLYTTLLVASAVCVGLAGHFGGQLVYGSTYVTSVLPWSSSDDPGADERSSGQLASPQAAAAPDVAPPPPTAHAAPEPSAEVSAAPRAPAAPPTPVTPAADTPAAGFPAPAAKSPAPAAASPAPAAPPTGAVAGPGDVPPTELVAVAPDESPGPPSPPAAPVARVDFARDVRPIFDATCVECHGPDKVRARLRMDSIAGLQQGGKSGPLVVPGDPETSLIMRRVLGLDGEDQMPLDKDPLTPEQLDVLRQWIAAGATFAP